MGRRDEKLLESDFVNLPKKQGWGGEMANCWSCSNMPISIFHDLKGTELGN
jgi:hypothetical protein